jgi:hypothetical protein
VKGEGGVQFRASSGGKAATLRAPAQAAWTWMKFDGTLDAAPARTDAGESKLSVVLSSPLYGSAVDAVLLCTDPDFSPEKAPRVRWPVLARVPEPTAQAVSPYAAKVSWPAAQGDTLDHYNLYCGEQADFPIDHATLVASPERGPFVDWGLRPGHSYHYRVTCVDRAGNESAASPAAQVRTPAVEPVVIEPAAGRKVVFRAPRDGVYALWVQLHKGPVGGQYLNLDMDGKKVTWTIVFDTLPDEAWFNYDQWGRFPLSSGEHTLTIDTNTKHVVQKILLTTDLSFKPEGHVNLLRGW